MEQLKNLKKTRWIITAMVWIAPFLITVDKAADVQKQPILINLTEYYNVKSFPQIIEGENATVVFDSLLSTNVPATVQNVAIPFLIIPNQNKPQPKQLDIRVYSHEITWVYVLRSPFTNNINNVILTNSYAFKEGVGYLIDDPTNRDYILRFMGPATNSFKIAISLK